MNLTSKLVGISVLLIVLLSVYLPTVSATNEDTAIQSIDQAEESVASGHKAVLEAEQAGADVSVLLDRLNIAGEHLAEAHMLLRLGDFDGSIYSADLASNQVGEDFITEAEKLKFDAQEYASERWSTNIIISVVGAIAVILGTYAAWLIFKRHNFFESYRR